MEPNGKQKIQSLKYTEIIIEETLQYKLLNFL